MIRNFLFHRVNPCRDELWDPMDVSLFEKSLKYISTNFTVVQLENILSDKKEIQKDKKFATILFDDGYKDNIEYAAPLLDKYKIKASFYVVTECIEENKPTWTYILDYIFQHTEECEINIFFDFLPEYLRVKKLKSHLERINYVKLLKPELKKTSHLNRIKVIKHIQQTFQDVLLPKIMMNWSDLQQLKNYGHYIGSHSSTHSMLGTMEDLSEIKKELEGSGEMIKTKIGYFPATISYPVGSYNQTTIQLSKEAGYKYGLAVKQKEYDPFKDNEFEIPRIELYNEAWWKVYLRINKYYEKISNLVKQR